MSKKAVKAVAIALSLGLTFVWNIGLLASAQKESAGSESSVETAGIETAETLYTDYVKGYDETARPQTEIEVFKGKTVIDENTESAISSNVSVAEEGMYSIEVTYKIPETQASVPAITVAINGEMPFYEAWQISLPQLFTDVTPVKEGDVEIPESVLVEEYQTRFLYDTLGYYGGLLEFYLPKGQNNISITAALGKVEITNVTLKQYVSPPEYKEAKKSLKGNKYKGEHIKVQAEVVHRKSDSTIFAVNDRSSAWVEPTSPYERYLNAIGGTNWQTLGQFVEWEIVVPEDGLYTLNVKYRKDTKPGLDSNRRIYIDGKIPYKELEAYNFKYTSTFAVETLKTDDGEEMLFELEKGIHKIKMEVAIGEYSSILPRIYGATQELQNCYRQFIMVMGTAPDSLRDYQLDMLIPDVLENMKEQRNEDS